MKSGIELITEERQRQMDVEGWTPENDDKYENGELPKAAACYALSNTDAIAVVTEGDYRVAWPWDSKWWKPGDPVRDLAKAGALIAAEIDRIQRREG